MHANAGATNVGMFTFRPAVANTWLALSSNKTPSRFCSRRKKAT